MSEYSTRDRSKLFKSGLVDTPDIQDAAVTVDKLAPDVATYIDDLATDSISVANTGSAGQPQLSYDSGTGVISLSGSEVEDATKEPMGHADKTQSTISFNESTRTFTISPVGASFDVWCAGVKYTFTTAQSVQIPNTTGIYYIYFNAGVLGYKTTFFTWESDAPTAYVYWNATTGAAPFFADERHGITLDHATHEYLHRTRGAAIASGFSASNYVLGGDGSSNTHAQLDIAGGTFFDEDLQVDIVHSNTPVANTWQQDLAGPAKIPMFYLSGTSWVRDTATDFPLKMSNSLPGYNAYNGSTWSVAEVADGKYATTWIIATNNLTYPIIALIGQSASDNAGQAEETQFSDLVLTGFPVVEFRPLYKLIFRVNSGYTNSVNASLDSIWDLRQVSSTAPSSFIASDHGNLSGLGDDDHLQYVHISEARSISANHTFSGSVNFTGSVNLPDSGVTAGSYGSASQVPVISVNADGLVTSASIVNVAGVTDFDYNTTTGVLDIDTADGGNFSTTVTLQPFDTADLAEGTNLYWTTARGESMFDTRLATKTTDNVAEGVTNLYYTSTRANADFDTRLATKSTTDVAEGTNLYYTDARFDARLALKSTDDLAEGSTNQYWTTARGESMFDSRLATKSTTDVAEGSNLYYTDARAKAAISVDGGLLTYNTGSVGLSSETIQDVVGAMVSTNTESGISVTYNDVGNVIDFAVDTATIATKSYVDSTIQAVIDAAPAALDTLNELAAAINDDANYAGTVTAMLATKVDKTTQVIAGTGMSGGGTLSTNVTISHADTSNAANLTASGRTYVTALSFDGFGHVTSYSTGTETVVDTNTTYGVSVVDGADAYTKDVRLVGSDATIDTVSIAVGAVDTVYGLTIAQASDKITISHANTSAVADLSSDNSNGVVIQDVALTFDTYGHVTGASVATVDLDGRYVNTTGDTMSGSLVATSFVGPVYGSASGATDATIWAVSRDQYPNWGIFYNEDTPDKIEFRSSGSTTAYVSLDDGRGRFGNILVGVGAYKNSISPVDDTNMNLDTPSGSVYVTTNIRSPIFYDSNNTSYYLDPANTSYIKQLQFDTNTGNKIDFYYSGEDRYGIQVQSSELRIHSGAQGSGTGGITFGKSTSTTFSEYMRVYNDGYVSATNSFRAPIFYDSDNTAAYANLAQTSGTIIATGASSDTLGYNPSYGIYIGGINGRYIYSGNSSYTGPVFYDGSAARTILTSGNYTSYRGTQLLSPNGATVVSGDATTAMPDAGNSFIHTLATGPGGNDGHILAMTWTGTSVYGAQLWLDTDPTNRMSLRSRSSAGVWNSWADVITSWSDDQVKSGYLQSNSSLRAPIFYDSNDTSKYVDPNGDTRLNSVYADNWFRAYGLTGLYSQSYGQHIYPSSDGYYWNVTAGGTSVGGIRIRTNHESTTKGYVGYYDSAGFGHLSGGSWWLNDRNGDPASLILGGSDGNNSYNSVTTRRLLLGGGNSDSYSNYYIGTNFENYGGNYNKLDIAWHTGVRIGADISYGGIRFFNNQNMGTLLWQFNGSSNYSYQYRWNNLTDAHGMYSGVNGAHFYPNNLSYGAWRIDGTRNGWGGIEFGNCSTSLMMNDNTYGFHRNGVGWKFYVESGNGYFPGNVTAYWSDRRLKENIKPLADGEGLYIINKLIPSRFNWKKGAELITGGATNHERTEVSLIAQEAQSVDDHFVAVNKTAKRGVELDGEIIEEVLTIDYDKITPYLIQAVKDLSAEIAALKQTIKEMKNGTN